MRQAELFRRRRGRGVWAGMPEDGGGCGSWGWLLERRRGMPGAGWGRSGAWAVGRRALRRIQRRTGLLIKQLRFIISMTPVGVKTSRGGGSGVPAYGGPLAAERSRAADGTEHTGGGRRGGPACDERGGRARRRTLGRPAPATVRTRPGHQPVAPHGGGHRRGTGRLRVDRGRARVVRARPALAGPPGPPFALPRARRLRRRRRRPSPLGHRLPRRPRRRTGRRAAPDGARRSRG